MIDYVLKKQVLDNGCVNQTKKLNKSKYLLWVAETNNDNQAYERAYKCLSHIVDYKDYSEQELKEAKRVLDSHYQRTCRLKNKINAYTNPLARMFYGDCVFLTLTFNNETLAKTSAETRRRYVARFLSSHCPNYVANIDYGGKRGREHYHAVILCDTINYKEWHQYGAVKGEKVRISDTDSPTKIAKYISKLTNHAIKETAKGNRMLYGRNGIKIKKDCYVYA